MTDRHHDGEFPTIDDFIDHLEREHWPVEQWAAEDRREALEVLHGGRIASVRARWAVTPRERP